MKARWKQYLQNGIIIIIGGCFIFILIETYNAKNFGFETKTFWDWMDLLIVPLFLAIGAILINQSEKNIERKITEDRAKLERELALDRNKETSLQSYLDRMSDLLLREKLRNSEENVEEVRNVARTRTLTVLRVLDSTRKGLVLRFLQEAGLITNKKSIVYLEGFDLSAADLDGADLRAAQDAGLIANEKSIVDLEGADLSAADLDGADLSAANFRFVNLRGAKLRFAQLGYADLEGADLRAADFGFADLHGANLRGANLAAAGLEAADLEGADLRFANLRDANLSTADLEGTDLRNANLKGARLIYADLEGADLRHANLSDAIVTNEQLAIAVSLTGATMPDGTKHE